ncbi:MAG: acyl-CoA dehydrogenase family protein [Gammaproteobacteria bacterium]|nr:acyl-CoA dehydrogenase family protein [Gammaproteobacteria bacterium]
MELTLSKDDRKFFEEVAAFLAAELDPSLSHKVKMGYPLEQTETREWTSKLNARGWAAPGWPVSMGGTGWTMTRRHLFDAAMRKANAPEVQGFGFGMLGPALIKYGTAAQQQRHLPAILNADISWCQGYSEPQAGSDLANLRTRAVSDGDDYLITGSKIWTSAAEHADWIFALVRTDTTARPQAGISFLLIDMRSPGVTVEPLIAFNGKRLWNQVFFDNVRVPKSNRLGQENEGWQIAKNLLGNERLLVSRVGENKRLLEKILYITRKELSTGVPADKDLERRLSLLEIRLQMLDATALRLLSHFDEGGAVGAEPSMLKLKGSRLVQDMDRLMFEAIGYYGLPLDSVSRGGRPVREDYMDMVVSGLFHHRGYTIAGGTTEVQYNIIAKAVLGL